MLYVIPIEPLEERYSAQWLLWTKFYLKGLRRAAKKEDLDFPYRIIDPTNKYKSIQNGAFLDVIGTNLYKNAQMESILKAVKRGMVKDGDVFWFHDMWFPGLEMLAYIRQGLGIDFKIYGCLHAGTYDPHDFLTKAGMEKWAQYSENAWFSLIDGIFVATQFHKKLVSTKRAVPLGKIHVTGFPIYKESFCPVTFPWYLKGQRRIVFPHRKHTEKNPQLFCEMEKILKEDPTFENYEFIFTKDICKDKDCYYSILKSSQFAVSFADQETWGIAMQEAVMCGCLPIVPNRLSYPELYANYGVKNINFLHDGTPQSAADYIKMIVQGGYPMHIAAEISRKQISNKLEYDGEHAIDKMISIMSR